MPATTISLSDALTDERKLYGAVCVVLAMNGAAVDEIGLSARAASEAVAAADDPDIDFVFEAVRDAIAADRVVCVSDDEAAYLAGRVCDLLVDTDLDNLL